MFKNIIVFFVTLFFISNSSSAGEIKAELGRKNLNAQIIPNLYIETMNKDGTITQEKFILTNEKKNLLNNSLEGIISLFEETAENLKKKNSDFEIKEVEIYASLQGEASVWIVKGATEASFKIILHPVKNK